MTDLKALRERAEKASEAPWTVGHEPQLNMVAECGDTRNGLSLYVFAYHLASAENDADFIAHAREDIPLLLDALAEARAVVEEQAAERHRYGGHVADGFGEWRKCGYEMCKKAAAILRGSSE